MFEDNDGKVSFMRVMGLVGMFYAGLMIACGIVGLFKSVEGAQLLIVSGSGIVPLVIGGKALQKQFETKKTGTDGK